MDNNSNEVKKNQIFTMNPKVQIRDEADNKYLLFNLENYQTLIINETGKFILEACDGTKTIEEIIKYIDNNYKYSEEQIVNVEKVVLEFIQLLFAKTLLLPNNIILPKIRTTG